MKPGLEIMPATDLLDRAVILELLPAPAAKLLQELDLQQVVDSTNALAMRRVAAGAGAGLVCLAEQQTAGRGRRGRSWISPFASNLYLSMVADFAGGTAATGGLSLAVGVAVVDALELCGVKGLQLKWPNDILFEGAKLGGILIEVVGDARHGCQVVIGVGLNVCMPESAAEEIEQSWTDISQILGDRVDRNQLMAAVLGELLPLAANYEVAGFSHWRERWQQRDAYANCRVVVRSGSRELAGTVAGIDETSGALLLDTGSGVQVIHGGEVSLRAAS
jgi:BirA family biotin operon repressor/biotin-[acetyl-CoA-carboxylase] ligase